MKRKSSTTKKKLASIAVCTALVLTLGTTMAFAEDSGEAVGEYAIEVTAVNANNSIDFAEPNPYKVFVNGDEVAINGYNINGSSYFALSDINAITGSYTVTSSFIGGFGDGNITVTLANEKGEALQCSVKIENGIPYYSANGGKTWSEVPEDIDSASITVDAVENNVGANYYTAYDGDSMSEGATIGEYDITVSDNDILKAVSAEFGEYNIAVEKIEVDGNTFVKLRSVSAVAGFDVGFENDTIFITTTAKDGEDATQDAVKKGMYYSSYSDKLWDGETSEDFIGSTIMVKNENDIYYYSTDGGETWNEYVPEIVGE